MILPIENLKPYDNKDVISNIPSFDEVKKCVAENQRIQLIKYFRSCYNTSLVDSKDTICKALENDDCVQLTLKLFTPAWKFFKIRNEMTKGDMTYLLLDKIEFALNNRDALGITDEQLVDLVTNITKNHLLTVN
jgi:hypothetical protein